jgi:tetratricopeptide (TPR) repeat protein
MAARILDEQAIFEVARKMEAGTAREAYLQQICGDDAAIGQRVRALLQAFEQSASFLEVPASGLVCTVGEPSPVGCGTVIGPYKLLEQIGEGGFGVVFLAEQQQPIRRKVALKVLKPGMDTRQVVARFEAERQALALMDHPHIAHVFDGGETASGRPYFVMELIRGIPMTDFCDQSQMPVRQRLELFVRVCQAVQHAHQRGIIHRDIKPSNVLVTLHDGQPVVKVIDFGIAKALGQHLTDKTLFTGFAQMIGTPLYMSPEQAALSNVDVDTRSDIYSLGVLLYELLTGTTPFSKERFREVSYDEMRRIIREEEPPRPSIRISTLEQAAVTTLSTRRQTDPRRLRQLFRGELDWIVMKALDKDRNRRYETASAFAADIERYLRDEPVQACPPSSWYRLRKFARRNKRGLAVASLILFFIALLGGGGGWVLRDREAREEELARDRAARQEAANQRAEDALAAVLRLVADEKWSEALGFVGQAETILSSDGGSSAISERAGRLRLAVQTAQSLEDARIKMTASKEDRRFDWEAGDAAYAEAFKKYGLDVDGPDPDEAARAVRASPIARQLIAALDDWAFIRWDRSEKAGWQRRLALARRADPHPWRNRLRDAMERMDYRALEQAIQAASPEDWQSATVLLGRLAEMAPPLRGQAAAVLRRAQQRFPDDFWINTQLAGLLHKSQPPRLQEAAHYFAIAVALRPKSAGAHNNFGAMLYQLGERALGIAEYRKALDLDPRFAPAYDNLGVALNQQGKHDEGIALCRKAIELSPSSFAAHINLGSILLHQGKLEEAVALSRKAVAINPRIWQAHFGLGAALIWQQKFEEAIAPLQKAIDLNPNNADSYCELGIALGRLNKLEESIVQFRKAIALGLNHARVHHGLGVSLALKRAFPQAAAEFKKAIDLKPTNTDSHVNLGHALRDQGHYAEASAWYDKAFELDHKRAPELALAHNDLGMVLRKKNQLDKAIDECRKAIKLDPKLVTAHNELGIALSDQGLVNEAIDEYRKAIAINPKSVVPHANLGNALGATGRLDEAVAEYHIALDLDPKNAGAYAGLGDVLLQQGKFADACASFRRCLELLPPRDAHRAGVLQELELAQRLLNLEPRLPEVLAGKIKPPSVDERLDFARLAAIKKLHAGAVRLYTESFADNPKVAEDRTTGHRYQAACSAALAACGRAADAAELDAVARARLRQQALTWLRADLNAWGKLLDTEPDKAHFDVQRELRLWQQEADFDGMRGNALDKLPEAEREGWRQLWADVEKNLSKARGLGGPKGKS